MSLHKVLCQSIHAEYLDRTSPGILVSEVGQNNWYAAVHRYPDGPEGRRVIVVKAYDTTFDRALAALALAWIVETRRVPKLVGELEENLAAVAKRVLA